MKKRVVFACVHSAGRSQMATAFFNRLVAPDVAEAVAAGTEPAERVHPEVKEAMAEVGYDLSGAKPQLLTEEVARGAALLVTLGCGEKCPFVPGLKIIDWALADPKGQGGDAVRQIREDVRGRVEALLKEQGWARGS